MQLPDLDAVRASYDAVADNYVATAMGDLTPEPWLRAALDAFVAFDGFADGDTQG